MADSYHPPHHGGSLALQAFIRAQRNAVNMSTELMRIDDDLHESPYATEKLLKHSYYNNQAHDGDISPISVKSAVSYGDLEGFMASGRTATDGRFINDNPMNGLFHVSSYDKDQQKLIKRTHAVAGVASTRVSGGQGDRLHIALHKLHQQRLPLILDTIGRSRYTKLCARAFSKLRMLQDKDFGRQETRARLSMLFNSYERLLLLKKVRHFRRWASFAESEVAKGWGRTLMARDVLRKSSLRRSFVKLSENLRSSRIKLQALVHLNVMLQRGSRRRYFQFWKEKTSLTQMNNQRLYMVLSRYELRSTYGISLMVQQMWAHWKAFCKSEYQKELARRIPYEKFKKNKIAKYFERWKLGKKWRRHRGLLLRTFLKNMRYKWISCAWKQLLMWKRDDDKYRYAVMNISRVTGKIIRLHMRRALSLWKHRVSERLWLQMHQSMEQQLQHNQLFERNVRVRGMVQVLRLMNDHRRRLTVSTCFNSWRLNSLCTAHELSISQMHSTQIISKKTIERSRWLKQLLWQWYSGTASGALRLWAAKVRALVRLERVEKAVTMNICRRRQHHIFQGWMHMTRAAHMTILRTKSRTLACKVFIRQYYICRLVLSFRTWSARALLETRVRRYLSRIISRKRRSVLTNALSIWRLNSFKLKFSSLEMSADRLHYDHSNSLAVSILREQSLIKQEAFAAWKQRLVNRKLGVQHVSWILLRTAKCDKQTAIRRWRFIVKHMHTGGRQLARLVAIISEKVHTPLLKSFRKWYTDVTRVSLWESRQALASLTHIKDQAMGELSATNEQLETVLEENKVVTSNIQELSYRLSIAHQWQVAAKRSLMKGLLIRMQETMWKVENDFLKRTSLAAMKDEQKEKKRKMTTIVISIKRWQTQRLLTAFQKWYVSSVQSLVVEVDSSRHAVRTDALRSRFLVKLARPCLKKWFDLVLLRRRHALICMSLIASRPKKLLLRSLRRLREVTRRMSSFDIVCRHEQLKYSRLGLRAFKLCRKLGLLKRRLASAFSAVVSRRPRVLMRSWQGVFRQRRDTRRTLLSLWRIMCRGVEKVCKKAMWQWKEVAASMKLRKLTIDATMTLSATQSQSIVYRLLHSVSDPTKPFSSIISEFTTALQSSLGAWDSCVYVRSGDALVSTVSLLTPSQTDKNEGGGSGPSMVGESPMASGPSPSPVLKTSSVLLDFSHLQYTPTPLAQQRGMSAVVRMGDGWVGGCADSGVSCVLEVRDIAAPTMMGSPIGGFRSFRGKLRVGQSSAGGSFGLDDVGVDARAVAWSSGTLLEAEAKARCVLIPLLQGDDVCGVLQLLMPPALSEGTGRARGRCGLRDVDMETASLLFETLGSDIDSISKNQSISPMISQVLQVSRHLSLSLDQTDLLMHTLVVLLELSVFETSGTDKRKEFLSSTDAERGRLLSATKDLEAAEQKAKDRIEHLEKSRAKYFHLCKQYKQELDDLRSQHEAAANELVAAESKLGLLKEQRLDVEHLHEVMRLVTMNALEEDELATS